MAANYAAVGGLKGQAAVYSIEADSLEREVSVNEPVTSTLWTGGKIIFATSQGGVKIFENGAESAALAEHSGAATALSVHPGGELLASVGADKSIVFYDLNQNKRVSRAYADACEYIRLPCGTLLIIFCHSHHFVRFSPRRPPVRRRLRLRRYRAVHDPDAGASGRL